MRVAVGVPARIKRIPFYDDSTKRVRIWVPLFFNRRERENTILICKTYKDPFVFMMI